MLRIITVRTGPGKLKSMSPYVDSMWPGQDSKPGLLDPLTTGSRRGRKEILWIRTLDSVQGTPPTLMTRIKSHYLPWLHFPTVIALLSVESNVDSTALTPHVVTSREEQRSAQGHTAKSGLLNEDLSPGVLTL